MFDLFRQARVILKTKMNATIYRQKFHLTSTAKELLDLLRSNYVADPAQTIVKSLNSMVGLEEFQESI